MCAKIILSALTKLRRPPHCRILICLLTTAWGLFNLFHQNINPSSVEPNPQHQEFKEFKEFRSSYEPLAPHPHAGARYPDGKYGYVADVTAVRIRHFQLLHAWKQQRKNYVREDDDDDALFISHLMKTTFDAEVYNYTCETPVGKGMEGEEGFKLIQKVKIGRRPPLPVVNETVWQINELGTNNETDATAEFRNYKESELRGKLHPIKEQANLSKHRILCALYTYDKHHPTMLQAAVNTWAWKCDGFLAASTLTNETLGAVDLPHLGNETYGNMWQKTRSIWGYIYDNYLEDFDYFWLGGDDFLVYVENLRGIIEDHESNPKDNPENSNEKYIPVFLGQHIPNMGSHYCGGGPGYVLNRVAVKALVTMSLPSCSVETVVSAEDRFISNCFRSIGIPCGSVTDVNGRQRFTGMPPKQLATFRGDSDRFYSNVYRYWGEETGRFKWGLDSVSEQLSGFHMLRYPPFIHRVHALQYPRTCPPDSVVGRALSVSSKKSF